MLLNDVPEHERTNLINELAREVRDMSVWELVVMMLLAMDEVELHARLVEMRGKEFRLN